MIDNAKTKSVIVANIMIGVLDPSKEFTSDLVQEVGERSYDAALKKAEKEIDIFIDVAEKQGAHTSAHYLKELAISLRRLRGKE